VTASIIFLVCAADAILPLPVRCHDETKRVEQRVGGQLRSERCVGGHGVIDGLEVSYYSNGNPVAIVSYRDGVRHGKAEYFYNDGTIWRRDEWIDGELASKWNNPEVANFSPEKRRQLGAASCGGVKTIVCGPNDEKPECKRTDPPLPPLKRIQLPRGQRAEGRFSDGTRFGQWTFRHPNGRLARRVEYSSGQLSWAFGEWYPDGRPKAKGEYLSGQKVGVWRFWDSQGTVTRKDFGDPLGGLTSR